jgi:polyisoprenoid-binding protein YceI
MKQFFWYLLIPFSGVLGLTKAAAQQYTPADQGSSVMFKLKNFGINTDGSFTGLSGKIIFNPKDLPNASFDVSIDAAKVNTGNEMRDEHLRKEEYFDVPNHPRIRFVSTSITPGGKSGSYQVNGKLTIKNTTRDLSFPFVATPIGNDYVFSGVFTINRKDFDIGGSSTISNSLTVSLTVFAKK